MNNAVETIIYKLTYNESYYGRDDAKIYVYYFKSAIQLVDAIPTIMNVMQDRNQDNFNVEEVKFYPGETSRGIHHRTSLLPIHPDPLLIIIPTCGIILCRIVLISL